jgi:anthranilate phosphoribosyltransferase
VPSCSSTHSGTNVLPELAPTIAKLTEGHDLTAEEVAKVFITTSREDVEGYYYLAFATALMAKGLTDEELYGLVEGLQAFSSKVETSVPPDEITDISGSGGDRIKTFNVSTAAAFIVACSGVRVAKQSFRAITSVCGSTDVLREVGVILPEDPAGMARAVEQTGITFIDYQFVNRGMEVRLEALQKLRRIGLRLPTPTHLIALAVSPVPMRRRCYGVLAARYVRGITHILRRKGYERGLVFHGHDGLSELSNVGPTRVAEFDADEVREYDLVPEDLGVRQAAIESISVADRDESINSFLQVLYGLDQSAKRDLVAINAGASLYIMGRTNSLAEGTEYARSLLAEGYPAGKLEEVVRSTGGADGLATLECRRVRAGI